MTSHPDTCMVSCPIAAKQGVNVEEGEFDFITSPDGTAISVRSFTFTNKNGMSVTLINYGATITKIIVPDRDGHLADVVLGFDNMEGYQLPDNPYFGATVGRVANRIGKGQFTLCGQSYQLAQNVGQDHLHGGIRGFDKVIWNCHKTCHEVVMTYLSKDGEENYPGDLLVTITFFLTKENTFHIKYNASSTKATIINLTNHSYFNLGGHASGAEELYKHNVMVKADHYTVTDQNSIPTGEILTVKGTTKDLTELKNLGEAIKQQPEDGFDFNYCINAGAKSDEIKCVGYTVHPPTGRTLTVYTDQPGVQIYTTNFLSRIPGKNETFYDRHGAICFETQNYPDAINHNGFPSAVLVPGQIYVHNAVYKFGIEN